MTQLIVLRASMPIWNRAYCTMLAPRRITPSFQALAAFDAAARYGNFSRAAQELSLTQSAVSKQVKQLEECLGVVLFERESRRVILTEAGKTFRDPARDLLQRMATATHTVMASAGAEGRLHVAILPTFAAKWLVPRLPGFQRAHTHIALHFTSRLERFDLEGTDIDLALHYGESSWPGAEAIHLFDELMVPAANPKYQQCHGLHRAEDLSRAELLQFTTRPQLWSAWFEMMGIACKQPMRGPLFDQFSLTAAAAMAGLGVALLPRILIDDEIAAGRLVILSERSMPGPGAYYVIVPMSKRKQSHVAAFVEWLLQETRDV